MNVIVYECGDTISEESIQKIVDALQGSGHTIKRMNERFLSQLGDVLTESPRLEQKPDVEQTRTYIENLLSYVSEAFEGPYMSFLYELNQADFIVSVMDSMSLWHDRCIGFGYDSLSPAMIATLATFMQKQHYVIWLPDQENLHESIMEVQELPKQVLYHANDLFIGLEDFLAYADVFLMNEAVVE